MVEVADVIAVTPLRNAGDVTMHSRCQPPLVVSHVALDTAKDGFSTCTCLHTPNAYYTNNGFHLG